jgi:plastocyanin
MNQNAWLAESFPDFFFKAGNEPVEGALAWVDSPIDPRLGGLESRTVQRARKEIGSMTGEGFLTRKRHAARAAVMAAILLALLVGTPWVSAAQTKPANQPEKIAATAPGAQITIENFEFNPATLTVPTGTTVTWISHDDEPHTVTSSDGVFASPGLDADETYSYTFSTPGTYTYHCKLHPHMTGTIIVK